MMCLQLNIQNVDYILQSLPFQVVSLCICIIFAFGGCNLQHVIISCIINIQYITKQTLAGLGIFTGIDLQPGENIAEPDIIIPLHDQLWHAGEDLDFWFLWNEYSW